LKSLKSFFTHQKELLLCKIGMNFLPIWQLWLQLAHLQDLQMVDLGVSCQQVTLMMVQVQEMMMMQVLVRVLALEQELTVPELEHAQEQELVQNSALV
jgi:hypothetical protein